MATKSISQLDTQATANETDLFEVAIVDENSASGYASKKESAAAIADAIVGSYQYPLRITGTTAKTIAGAINELKQLVDLLPQFAIEVVQTLPVSDISETTIYLVPASDPEQGNYYEEYIYVNNAWELVGTTAVDLSGYYTSAQVDTLLSAKANSADLATVATSGAYSDLSGKPTIDTVLDTTSTNAVENRAVASAINEIADEISSSNTTDNEPYLLRDSASGTADRMVDELVGGTVAFNQIFNFTENATQWRSNGTITREWADDVLMVSGGNTVSAYTYQEISEIKDHCYLYLAKGKTIFGEGVSHRSALSIYASDATTNITKQFNADPTTVSGIWKASKDFTNRVQLRPNHMDNELEVNACMIIDLTQMFGATIADYIYSLEQATAGAGVAFFRNMFPDDYYAYSAGELMSVKATAHKMKDASDNVIGNYPLDADLELRGLFKLDANNNLYCDGDTYESSGKVTRKYRLANMGAFGWHYVTSQSFFSVVLSGKKAATAIICGGYTFGGAKGDSAMANASTGIYIGYGSTSKEIKVKDTRYTNATDFRNAMNSVYLVYELETPTTETAASFAGIQVVDGDGTEEYVDSRAVPIPVGHNTTYIHGLNEYRTAVESYLASLDARITALENASNNRSISVSPTLTKSLTNEIDANESILEDTKETEEETKEEAQKNER